MRVIDASHEVIDHRSLTPTKFIELIGRTCYKSIDKIAEYSDKKFIQGLVKSHHYAMIEHFWVHCVIEISYEEFMKDLDLFSTTILASWGRASDLLKFMQITDRGKSVYLSCPIRVLVEMYDRMNESSYWDGITLPCLLVSCANEYPDFFQKGVYTSSFPKFKWYCEEDFAHLLKDSLCQFNDEIKDREIMKHMTHTVKFVCDRGVSHELVRHRPCSFAQESQRYCNYTKDKFGDEITFILPFFFKNNPSMKTEWSNLCTEAEKTYFDLINAGAKPEEARSVLPNSTKTEIIMTANESEWQHIVDLRAKGTTGKPHPQMREIMIPYYEELKVLSEGRIK